MGIIIRQSFWNSIWSYIGIALGYINLVLLFPRFLEPDEFGLTRVFVAASLLTAQFGTLGLGNIAVKYFPYFKTSENNHHNGFLFFIFLIATFGSILCTTAIILFKPLIVQAYEQRSALFVEYYYWLIPFTIALIYFRQYAAYARVLLKTGWQTFAREVVPRSLQLFIIVPYALGWMNFNTFIILFVLSNFGQGILVFIYLATQKTLNFLPSWEFYKSLPGKSITKYGIFVLFSQLGSYLAGSIDVLMLGAMAKDGLADVAIYSVAFYIGNIVVVPIRSLSGIAMPIVADAWKQSNMKKIQEIYTKSSINQLVIGVLLLVGLWSNIDNLFEILPHDYADGKWVVFSIAFGQLVNIGAGINAGIILNSPYYRFDAYFIALMVILNIVLNIIFIKLYGITGAAYATAFSLIIVNIGQLLVVWFKSRMQPFSKKTIYILLFGLAIYVVQSYMPRLEPMLLDMAIRSVLILLLFIPGIYFFNISEEINSIIQKVWKKVF